MKFIKVRHKQPLSLNVLEDISYLWPKSQNLPQWRSVDLKHKDQGQESAGTFGQLVFPPLLILCASFRKQIPLI